MKTLMLCSNIECPLKKDCKRAIENNEYKGQPYTHYNYGYSSDYCNPEFDCMCPKKGSPEDYPYCEYQK